MQLGSSVAVAVTYASAAAAIGPLTWGLPYAAGAALKIKEKKKKRNIYLGVPVVVP